MKSKNKVLKGLTLLFFIVLSTLVVLASDPEFINIETGEIFQVPQDQMFELYVLVNDSDGPYPGPPGDYPLTISYALYEDNAKNFSAFILEALNDTAALINFTPENDDVIHNDTYAVYLIAEDNAAEITTIKVYFNVSNVNDAPSITESYPITTYVDVPENTTETFNQTTSDPDTAYGDSLRYEWWLNGTLTSENATYNLTTDFCDSDIYNVTLIAYDSENDTATREWIVNVTNVNRLPAYNTSPVIQNYTWSEDSNNTNLFNLSDYFYDLDSWECSAEPNNDTLTYSVTGNTNIEVIIENDTHNVSFYVQDDWFGVEEITFTVNDSHGTTDSSVITLNVTNINDPPVLKAIANESAWEFAHFRYQVNATDADVDVNPLGDSITYSENISSVLTNLTINSSTGVIDYTPSEGDEGTYMVNITATDEYGGQDSSIMNLTVYDNSRPGILPITNETANENSPYELIVYGVDPDDDSMNFTSDYTRFTVTSLNSTAANFSFTPTDSDVGDHIIVFTVYDIYGATNTTTMNLSIIDVNMPPVLDTISDQSIRQDKNLSLVVTASDADNDNMTFRTNSTLFAMETADAENGIGYINLTTNSSIIGNHSINVTVNDTHGLEDSQIFNLEIVPNSAPVIDPITTPQNTTTYVLYEIIVSAADSTTDTLTFTSNFTGFTRLEINDSAASFSYTFQSDETGLINITMVVNDDLDASTNTSFILNITHTNNAPTFVDGISNRTFVKGFQYSFIVIATDADNESLTFNTNTSFMNITLLNDTSANFTFHTELESIGNVSIFINVTDGFEVVTEHVLFTIRSNSPPVIDFYLPSDQNPVTAENDSIDFNQTSSDSDNSEIYYQWQLAKINETIKGWCLEYNATDQDTCEDNNRSIVCQWDSGASECSDNFSYFVYYTRATTQNWTFAPNWTEAGNYSVKLFVYDIYNGNTSHLWNLTVNDTNRLPYFGKKIYSTYADFSGGTIDSANISSDNKIMLDIDVNDYYPSGNYTSAVIDFDTDTYLSYGTIEWSAEQPGGTNITFKTRTSVSSVTGWSGWSNPYYDSGTQIESDEKQHMQYLINLTTTDTSMGVNVTRVTINYEIDNLTISGAAYWLDLDAFFTEDDEDNTLSYEVTGNTDIIITIVDISNSVTVTPSSGFTGTETIYFTASDNYGSVNSNNISITVQAIVGQPTVTVVSAGGGTSITETKIKKTETNITTPVAFELVVPGMVTIYKNMTMSVPISLKNNENFTLVGIGLNALSQVADMDLKLDEDYFDILKPDEEKQTMLSITPYKTYGSYEIIITASVESPRFEDTAKLFINSLEKGEWNETQLNTKVDFARDLLTTNPECLELNELIEEAQKAIQEGLYEKANSLLESTIEGCKYLISEKEALLEMAIKKTIIGKIFDIIMKYRALAIVAAGILVMGILVTGYIISKRATKKRTVLPPPAQ